MVSQFEDAGVDPTEGRPLRADAQRNIGALLKAALDVFATEGVDATVRAIADRAGVGIATLYRHFPHRADLVAAVFRHEVDTCADEAPTMATSHPPAEALAHWMQRYAAFIATKRGLASALHPGHPSYGALHEYFNSRLQPALRSLLDAAAASGEIRGDLEPEELLGAVASMCMQARPDRPEQAKRMVALLVDGLRYGALVNARPTQTEHRGR